MGAVNVLDLRRRSQPRGRPLAAAASPHATAALSAKAGIDAAARGAVGAAAAGQLSRAQKVTRATLIIAPRSSMFATDTEDC